MLGITIKNILKNKALNLCLVIGFILSIAVVCAVPTYTKSVLNSYIQDIFINADNRALKQKDYIYPASIAVSRKINMDMDYKSLRDNLTSIKGKFFSETNKVPITILAEKTILSFDNIRYKYTADDKSYSSVNNKIMFISDFDKHIKIIKGTLAGNVISENNSLEVIVDNRTFDNFKLEINKSYEITNISKEIMPKIKIVGVYEIKDKNDPFWLDKNDNLYCNFMATDMGFFNFFKNNEDIGSHFKLIKFEDIYDYKSITSSNAKTVYKELSLSNTTFARRTGFDSSSPITENLKTYLSKESLYSTVMWIFLVPVLLVVMYYIWMISELIVDSDKEQIAVLKSRGASRFEVLRLYLYEGLFLSFIGLLAGPLLGVALCKAMSYSDGFLSFNNTRGIKILIDNNIWLYSIITVLILLVTLLLSVFFATQKSIVEVRQNKNRYVKLLTKNKYMDFILLAIAFYGYYNYNGNKVTQMDNTPLDPMLYLVSTIFTIGAGMFLLRIYKYIINIAFKAGKNKFSTAFYIAIINVVRYHLKKSAALLFVVITVAIGVFNIHIAKDINTSYENTVKYTTGADLIVKGIWNKVLDKPIDDKINEDKDKAKSTNAATEDETNLKYKYIEPSYLNYSKIEGIESYTKVLRDKTGQVALGSNTASSADILGIIPHEFGKIANFDSSLLKTHWYNYLNNMTERKDLVLISAGLSSLANINPGDVVFYKVAGGLSLKGVVYDVVDYWPGYSNLQNSNLVIANYDYISSHLAMYPYEIWMKKKQGVTNEIIYNSIKNNKIALTDLKNLSVENYNAKNDIFLKGTNAVLNLGFLSIGAITVLGFVVYWLLSLKTRNLSFGIYRSLGVASKNITIMLLIEQLLTLGSSILIGVLVGNISISLFMPLIKGMWYKNRYVIPAKNLQYTNEYLQLAAILAVIIIISFVVLTKYIKTLKINQAIKLGED